MAVIGVLNISLWYRVEAACKPLADFKKRTVRKSTGIKKLRIIQV
jgi:hypothetical protein